MLFRKASTTAAWMATLFLMTIAEDVPNDGTKLKKLCSEDLSQAYILACLGRGSQMFGKRSLMPLPALNALTAYYDNEADHADWPDWPWLEPHRAHNVLMKHNKFGKRFHAGGLADECCLKPCYLEELLSYCPNNLN